MESGFQSSIHDIISNLPDPYISHIFSFLPTKDAVKTSALSKRWIHKWRLSPNIDIDDTSFMRQGKDAGRMMQYITAASKCLLNRESLVEKFDLRCKHDCNSVFVHTWICAAISLRVQHLSLGFGTKTPQSLPRMLFTCERLAVLRLSHAVVLDTPVDVSLPRLKILDLDHVRYSSKESLQDLLQGCPILEELNISRDIDEEHWVVNVSALSLKSLRLYCRNTFRSHPGSYKYQLELNAPYLECLDLKDEATEDFLTYNLYSLARACVDVHQSLGVFQILRGVSDASFISISQETLQAMSNATDNHNLDTFDDVHAISLNMPTFSKLIRLEIAGDNTWRWLNEFLENSPNLRVLVMKEAGLDSEDITYQWSTPKHVPVCLLSSLEEIEIREFYGDEYEIEAIKFLLVNGKVLRKVTVDCTNSEYFDDSMKLTEFPKGSSNCELNLIF